MSILIKGMEMPRNCAECFFHKVFPATGVGINQLYCALCGINIVKLSDAQPDCPLVPIPPHGDLIDRDELMKHKGNCYDADGHLLYAVGTGSIMCAPTIIQAEEGE